MAIPRHLAFCLSRTEGKTRLCVARMRLSMPRQGRKEWKLRTHIEEKDWDPEAMSGRLTTPRGRELVKEIEEARAAVDEVFARYELIEKRIPNIDEVKEQIDEALGRVETKSATPVTVQEVGLRFIAAYEGGWRPSTRQVAVSALKSLAEFRPSFAIDDVNDDTLHDFINFLQFKGRDNSTCGTLAAKIRQMLRWAAKEGLYRGKSHDTFHPRLKGVNVSSREVIYLTHEELEKVMDCQLDNKGLEEARDVFVFCCFSGLRYSDAAKLRRCDISGGCINVVTQKTSDALHIELNDRTRTILRKYEGRAPEPTDRLLPVPALSLYNERLHIVARLAGVETTQRIISYTGNERHESYVPKWSVMSSHVARRTFVVMALRLGIAPDVIMRWTGHSSYEAMKPYIAIVDELKRSSMNKFNTL